LLLLNAIKLFLLSFRYFVCACVSLGREKPDYEVKRLAANGKKLAS